MKKKKEVENEIDENEESSKELEISEDKTLAEEIKTMSRKKSDDSTSLPHNQLLLTKKLSSKKIKKWPE